MIELALKSLEVKYTCDESYDELKNPTYYFTFKNIEDIKFTSPELYAEYKRILEVKANEREDWKQKEEIILEFLESPKTKNQITNMIEKKFYPKKDQNASCKYYIESHVGCIIDSLNEKV
ncbi:MAG: hypothetical protein K0B11_02825 [Mariniphaga sp.]|nr:hypothetical protein [Mariniphaga sp.]